MEVSIQVNEVERMGLEPYGQAPWLTILGASVPVGPRGEGRAGHGRRASFADYGPYATLNRPAPRPASQWEVDFVASAYGDEVGEAYARSVSEFVSGLPEPVRVWAHSQVNEHTLGGHGLATGVWGEMIKEQGRSMNGEDV
ncbi:hypothetical protein BJ684DRAFT_21863 [Piptocephalis cylindrospora]|uniref:Uncharacterized protein n=1 Tax=Piptocephalis cylindrospora TaxID=1907219 RepID=A0A4P9XYN2_9FUNG|nr:hypothetical protein BJ684DRAFT_21863 [Piptocephalis cylindrospora]|eukprot:RKP11558.1 hypothetical protein BJ684DRAFT_21863 [Piptocephalis cylindrospora]